MANTLTKRSGWVTFAGVTALVVGGYNALSGIAALSDDDTLTATLRAYADCDMNVARTAERLVVHPNTVHYRLRRIAEATGRDPRRFGDLLDLLLATRLGESSRNA